MLNLPSMGTVSPFMRLWSAPVVWRGAHVVPRLCLGSGLYYHVVLAGGEARHGLLLRDEVSAGLRGLHFLHDAIGDELRAVAVLDAVGNDAGDVVLCGLLDVDDAPAASAAWPC